MAVEFPNASKLLAWYDRHARDLPWRVPPGGGAADTYRVWLSEVMLQQTTVAAAKGHFLRFVETWPTVEALSVASQEDVMRAWAGLGYYSRARNLHAAAKRVVELGAFPQMESDLRRLPGVGAYTAAAIAAIALGQKATVVDANVERVVARLFAVESPLPGARARLNMFAASITPDERCGDFAQAMMDLGSLVCTPRAPSCAMCPLQDACAGSATGAPAAFPRRAIKTARPERFGTAYWFEKEGKVLLVRRPPKGLLGGMLGLPCDDWLSQTRPPAPIATVRHVFTHFALTLDIVGGGGPVYQDGVWWGLADIKDAGLPTLFAKAVSAAGRPRHGDVAA